MLFALLALTLVAAACGGDSDDSASTTASGAATDASVDDDSVGNDSGVDFEGPLVIGAIPDQDPELLARNYDLVADYLAAELGIDVEFQPVTEYDAAVTAFRVGDLQLVWFGALTGVQARLQVDGAEALAQRDIDDDFTSVFIAGTDTGLEPIDDVEGLSVLADRTLTFGSESSTSGRLMPQSFLSQAGLTLDDLDGEPGFSGSHDTTIELVESGTFEVGAVSSQVWNARVEAGEVDLDKVQLLFETPTYFNYHWVARPELGSDLQARIVDALKGLDPADEDEAVILDFFGAESFVDTVSENYDNIESVGREIGRIDG
jgi:phosphonate transport system substrate-binding protein